MAKFDKIAVLQKIGATGMVPVYYNGDMQKRGGAVMALPSMGMVPHQAKS